MTKLFHDMKPFDSGGGLEGKSDPLDEPIKKFYHAVIDGCIEIIKGCHAVEYPRPLGDNSPPVMVINKQFAIDSLEKLKP